MIRLPVVGDCSGCGACCHNVSSPPGYAVLFPPPGVRGWMDDGPDCDRVHAMPAELRQELARYYHGRRKSVANDGCGESPCIWFDLATRRCKHYEWRPDICRGFEVGGEDCRRIRKERGID